MAFPATELAAKIELYISGAWTDITSDVLVRDGISITRGLRDEGARSDPGKCSLSIKNTNGKYSPRNPSSPYYGLISRNTPIRISVSSDVRFVGEVSEWPPRWDVSGKDVWTPVEASGILRRLGQSSSLTKSVMYRGLTYPEATDPPVAYWPCEDAVGSSSLASAIGGPPMKITGSPTLASYSGFLCSDPIPVLAGSEWSGVVPAYSTTGAAQVRFLMYVPAAGTTDGQTICRIRTTGSAQLWHLNYKSGGGLQLQAFADSGGVLDTGTIAFGVNGKLLRVSIELQQSGANIAWNMLTLEAGATTGSSWSGTLNSQTLGSVNRITISPVGGISTVAIGHVSVQSSITALFDLADQLKAWDGETAGNRLSRLCAEEGIPFSGTGSLSDTAKMGPQLPATILELITRCAEADMGALFESRSVLGLAYVTRISLYNQISGLALNYTSGHLSPPLEPVDDDQGTVNDVTVSRSGGSSARATRDAGPLSTADPPSGVGRYDASVTLYVDSDATLQNQASWRVFLGTIDEARYPQVTLDLANSNLSALVSNAIILDVGYRITIDNPPAWLPPDQISQIAWGFTETLEPFGWKITINCSPESPYQVAVYNTDRYDAVNSTLNSGVNSSATSLSVATSTGPLWTTDAGDMPISIRVGGEKMTVTAISGSSSPQTFMVTRSANGVVKSHSAGATVSLFKPGIRAL